MSKCRSRDSGHGGKICNHDHMMRVREPKGGREGGINQERVSERKPTNMRG